MPFISLTVCTVVLYITCVAHGLMLHVPHALSALVTDFLGVLHTLVSERRAWCFTWSCVWQASCLAWFHSSRTTFLGAVAPHLSQVLTVLGYHVNLALCALMSGIPGLVCNLVPHVSLISHASRVFSI